MSKASSILDAKLTYLYSRTGASTVKLRRLPPSP